MIWQVFVSSDRELTRLGVNGERLSEDDDDSSDNGSPKSGGSVGSDRDSDDNKLVGQRDPPVAFDDAFSADVELMKAMGLPLGFSGFRSNMGPGQEVMCSARVLCKTSYQKYKNCKCYCWIRIK